MTRDNKKKIITAGIIGGTVFSVLATGMNHYILGHEFSWILFAFYFTFGFFMYGYLAYRSYKKSLKK